MATEVKRAIRTAAEWTTNQAAMETLYGVGNYYTTLTAWEAAEQADLVAADEVAVLECYDDWPSGLADGFQITGWTTDITRNIIVRAAPGEGHGGIRDAGFRTVVTVAYDSVFRVDQAYVTVQDIQCERSNAGAVFYSNVASTYADILFERCIGIGGSGAGYGCFYGRWATFRSCVAYDSLGAGYGFGLSNTNYGNYIDNCTAINCTNGFSTGAVDTLHRIKNCIAYNCGVSYESATSHADSTKNAASDASINTPPGSSPILTDVVSEDFADAANGDATLSKSSALKNAGASIGLTVDVKNISYTDSDGGTWLPVGASRGVVEIIETLKTSLGDYTTIGSWITAAQRNLPNVDECAVLECYTGSHPTSAVLNGFTTSRTCYPIIRAAVGHEHLGVRGAGVVHNGKLGCYDNYFLISDIEIIGYASYALYTNNSGTFKNLIVEQTSLSNGHYTIYGGGFVNTNEDSLQVLNCITIGGDIGIFGTRGWSIINCTAAKPINRGYAGGSQQKVINCIFHDVTTASGFDPSSYGHSNNICIAASIDADAGPDSFFVVDKDDIFVDFINEDFRLKTTAPVINKALDVSGYLTDDIAGYGRA